MRPPIGKILSAVLAVLFLGTGLGACASDHADATPTDRLVVRQNDRVVGDFVWSQLQSLPQVEIVTPQSHGNQIQKGPTVRSILTASGVTDIAAVRVEGRDPAQTLTAAELTDRVVLSVTKRNTLKLAGTDLDRDRWVRDVTTLVVNP